MKPRLLPAFLILAAGCGPSTPVPAGDPPARTATPGISEAVAKLGSDDWDERRDGAEAILAAGRDALPALAEARQSTDLEVSSKACQLTRILEEEPIVWVGTQDDRWENAENWSPKQVPTAWSRAIIPQTPKPLFAPTIRETAEVHELVLLRRSELTVEEQARLTVSGRMRTRGVLRALGVVDSNSTD
ncbi:MAG: hypothetical protein HUU15_15030 [Candidatus Brocadiae bacterium]|nr:hypothetical protein [Candidatus Brocadiia bacterium]